MTDKNRVVNVNITFRNIEGTDAIKTYVVDKVTHCVQKFAHKDTDTRVVLSVERNRQIAELNVRYDGHDIHAKEERGDLYAAIDALIDTVSQQLRKHKEKASSHH